MILHPCFQRFETSREVDTLHQRLAQCADDQERLRSEHYQWLGLLFFVTRITRKATRNTRRSIWSTHRNFGLSVLGCLKLIVARE